VESVWDKEQASPGAATLLTHCLPVPDVVKLIQKLRQGKKKRARQMLAKIYGWFTEGFDTQDLQEAKALLEKLA
jgi:hypothetical protein